MNSIQSLREKLSSLISSGRSGIIALCGDSISSAGHESFWENHDALVYIQPLETVMAVTGMGTVYQNADKSLTHDAIFKNFERREDFLSLDGSGLDEKMYLDICMDSLLNDMAHDDGECPELDCDGHNERYIYPSDCDPCYPDMHFTITCEADIASDIVAVREAMEIDGSLTIRTPKGKEKHLFASVSADGEYSLSTCEQEVFPDEDTGTIVPVQVRVNLLWTRDWRTFYAKSRLFIYQNYVKE